MSCRRTTVASREGGVDRNLSAPRLMAPWSCRLPRGGRGSQPQVVDDPAAQADVASREGGVDRNLTASSSRFASGVASREGGVDRNIVDRVALVRQAVASREGGVDRNTWPPTCS